MLKGLPGMRGAFIFTLVAVLLLPCTSCQLLQQAAQGISSGMGGQQGTAPNQAGASAAPGSMAPATKADIDALWNSYSAADRKLLSDNFMDRSQLDGFENMLDVTTIRSMLDSQLAMLQPMKLHNTGVLAGTALHWRELASYTDDLAEYAVIMPGNFDEDADDELLVHLHGFEIIELDGSRRSLSGLDGTELGVYGVWDMDHDGRSELLAVQSKQPSNSETGIYEDGDYNMRTVMMGLDGAEITSMDGMSMFGPAAFADLDADGYVELLLSEFDMDTYAANLTAYGRGGREIWQQADMGANGVVAGDVDGDGRDELLGSAMDLTSGMPGRVLAYGLQQEPAVIAGLTDNSLIGPPQFCLDINGDGTDEILIGRSLLNPVDGSRIRLDKPAGWDEMVPGGMMGLGAGLLLRDGQPLLCARTVEGLEDWRADTLLMWDGAGKLVYQEHLGEELQDLRVAHSSAGDRVVLQTKTRLLVSEE